MKHSFLDFYVHAITVAYGYFMRTSIYNAQTTFRKEAPQRTGMILFSFVQLRIALLSTSAGTFIASSSAR